MLGTRHLQSVKFLRQSHNCPGLTHAERWHLNVLVRSDQIQSSKSDVGLDHEDEWAAPSRLMIAAQGTHIALQLGLIPESIFD